MEVEYNRDDSPTREHRDEGIYDDLEENGNDKSSRHRSKDRKKSSRGEEKDDRSRDRERSRSDVVKEREKESKELEKDRVSSKERRKDDRDDRYKDKSRDNKVKEKDYDQESHREKEHDRGKDRKDRGKEKEREKEREVEKDSDRGREKERGNRDKDREREKERDKAKEKEREKGREKHKDREKGRESYKDTDRERAKDKYREKERELDQDKDKSRDRGSRRSLERDDKAKLNGDDNRDKDILKQRKVSDNAEDEQHTDSLSSRTHLSASELEERILKTKEEGLKKKTEDVPEVLAWVSRSRKIEEKRNAEKRKAIQLSKIFEERDNIGQGESEDEETAQDPTHDLAGVKVLHGLDKVMEGGAVVLTLKDQNILADGGINEDIDMLENVEIGEQKQRDEAYKAAKKKTGVYVDKFNDDPAAEKKMLPQYDDPIPDEGLTLDERGHFTGEAEKKIEELHKRIQGVPTKNCVEDLNMSGKINTQDEMLQFKKPKKKKSLRKREKLDLEALEAEAVSAGLGVEDLGSRNDARRRANKEEQERLEAERRNRAYQLAYARADEASKSLRLEQTLSVKREEDETPVFVDDDDDLYKSLEKARKLALKKEEENAVSGPQAVALLATTTASSQTAEEQIPSTGEAQDNKVVLTEMEEFVWGLQLDEESHKPESEDVFMQEDEPEVTHEEKMDEPGGWTEVNDMGEDKQPANEDKEETVPDETIHEVAVGKGLSGVLKLLKDRGTLKEGIDWGGRNMDKKKSKLFGIVDDDDEEQPKETHTSREKKDEQRDTRSSSSSHQKDTRAPKVYQEKDIRIERTDEFGRTGWMCCSLKAE
ncbi:SART-1 family protein DOT2-like isoform X2 [Malus sylvestris]|uniref:SART-1 family protein DOT2-like isoform X2 n=1 Tax=Malus sylvestris TaxID=3752 RepID=UPI0021AC47D1|nr:SART-1 family protein DOT2-like isoform X2 [Malus sylvestris]